MDTIQNAQHPYRMNSIDVLRGLVMVIMALDHARDLLHFGALTEDPLALATTTAPLFFTRWITHFCAPVFVFLSGTSIYLQSLRKSKKELSVFLVKRGLWLIAAEVVLVTLGISFDLSWGFIFLQVIWAIGISMVLLSAFIWAPFPWLLALGVFIVGAHNGLDVYEAQFEGNYPVWYQLLHRPAFLPLNQNHLLGILYPFLPWTGLMILGYCFGRFFQKIKDQKRLRIVIARTGMIVLVLFFALRFLNVYGDPRPWALQDTTFKTFLSFIDTQKYPPSLLYLCMTLGPALLLLAHLTKVQNGLTRLLTVYGRVPFFYYLVHFYLLHLVTAVLYVARGHSVAEGYKGTPGIPFKFVAVGEGLRLWQVYLVWLAVVIFL